MDALLGQMIGRYHVQQLLNQSRLGNLYQALDVNLDRPVALRVLSATLTQQPEFANRFAQLARLAVRLDQPGLLRVYDFGQAADHYFVASEWLAGPTLAQLLATVRTTQQWITLAEAQRLVLAVGQAVEAAQRQGAERRLITPDKIMFRWGPPKPGQLADYQPVLVDLGLSTLFDEAAAPRHLPPRVLAYLAPELLFRPSGDARSAIYMLGALFYELALGQPPLHAETVGQAIDAHLHQAIALPQTLAPDLPVAVADLLQQAMAYAPAERYLTLAALLADLVALPDLATTTSLPAHAKAGAVALTTLYRPTLCRYVHRSCPRPR
jgi:eukaryotic-like serine/threonine-protein kinase